MSIADHQTGYSALVRLELHVNGEVLRVGQVGDGSLILQEPRRLPATDAVIVVIIDGERDEHPVVLCPSDDDDAPDEVFFW